MQYELTYIIPAKYEEGEIPKLQSKVRDILTGAHATIVAEQSLGKRKLAFPIKQIRHGYYLSTVLEVEQQAVKTIDHELRVAPDILRFLFTKTRVVSPAQRAKEEHLRERLQAERMQEERAAKEVETEKERATKAKPEAPKLTSEELDKKIEEMLGNKMDT